MMLIIGFIMLTLGIVYFIGGIRNKPPLESMQSEPGWEHSRFLNRYFALIIGAALIVAAVSAFKTFFAP